MARLFLDQEPLTQYKDRKFQGSLDDYLECLRTSTTLYIGNVSFYTNEEQIWEIFSKVGVRAAACTHSRCRLGYRPSNKIAPCFFADKHREEKCQPYAWVVRTIIMGLDKNLLTPCGFCFVEYHNRNDAERAVKYLNGTKLDDREIRIDFDGGFLEGRQLGWGWGWGTAFHVTNRAIPGSECNPQT